VKKLKLSLSDAAATDILEQADWYERQANTRLSRRWNRAVWSALSLLAGYPRSGALCTFTSRELREIRRAYVSGFPKHLIFYRIESDRIFVLRVAHGARDLESLFTQQGRTHD
jgi:plasmid stabilization system protein ParE